IHLQPRQLTGRHLYPIDQNQRSIRIPKACYSTDKEVRIVCTRLSALLESNQAGDTPSVSRCQVPGRHFQITGFDCGNRGDNTFLLLLPKSHNRDFVQSICHRIPGYIDLCTSFNRYGLGSETDVREHKLPTSLNLKRITPLLIRKHTSRATENSNCGTLYRRSILIENRPAHKMICLCGKQYGECK